MAGMVKWDLLPMGVRADLIEKCEDHHSLDETRLIVEQMTPKLVFADWLEWNGIVNWASTLYDMPALIKAAAL